MHERGSRASIRTSGQPAGRAMASRTARSPNTSVPGKALAATTNTPLLDKPLSKISFCYLGDARFNMGNSYLVDGAKLGMDVRIASPSLLRPRDEIVELARSVAEETGAKITLT